MCTFPGCRSEPDKLYASRRAWFEHELIFHRRQWACPLGCTATISDAGGLQVHLKESHSENLDAPSLKVFARGQDISADAEASCPFCAETVKPRHGIRSHIGRHQLQAALMVLQVVEGPRDDYSDEDPDDEPIPGMGDFPPVDSSFDRAVSEETGPAEEDTIRIKPQSLASELRSAITTPATTPASRGYSLTRGRSSPLSMEARAGKAIQMRKTKACIRCRIRRVEVVASLFSSAWDEPS